MVITKGMEYYFSRGTLSYLRVCHNTQGDPRWLPILDV